MTYAFTNFATTTLAGNVLAGDVTFSVAAGTGALFPAAGAGTVFDLVIFNTSRVREIVRCTSRTVDTFTVTRAQESTTARAWSLGDGVSHRASAIWYTDIEGNVARLDRNNTFTKGNRGAYVALTSAASSIAIELNNSNNFSHTLTENTTLATPTTPIAGQSGVIQFTQHASAAKTLAFSSFWKKQATDTLTISTTLSSINVLCYVTDPSGTFATCTMQTNVS